ncbi:hypothetical protein [Clostridium kluyveri]|uniref:DUF2178 domain-containing protein n=1 Tax=Clostridium kluyveri TaxID=1534 RepID=A0A1L5F342_CLOKL|nr:hypothetical protein [Clostridium kluyveri]APM37416.1 hypothetical protein BS101_00875 [Clostridium kluyveri]UZQ48529.1 hypothetical protein OP486_10945 [Clostridium kluyveri]
MNYAKKQFVFFIVYTVIGIVAFTVALFHNFAYNYSNGLIYGIAGACTATGILGTISSIRLINNPKKAERIEIAKNEERTQLIRMKSHSSAYTIIIFLESITTIILGFLRLKEASITIATILIAQIIITIIFLSYYSKKY